MTTFPNQALWQAYQQMGDVTLVGIAGIILLVPYHLVTATHLNTRCHYINSIGTQSLSELQILEWDDKVRVPQSPKWPPE